jgi:hypothetical protein
MVSPLSTTRTCFDISREIVGRMKEYGCSQYGIVFETLKHCRGQAGTMGR